MDIGHGGCNGFSSGALCIGVDLAAEGDDAILDRVGDVRVHLVLDERGVEVLLNALVEVGVDGTYFLLRAGGDDGDLVGDDLSAGQGVGDGFGLGFLLVRGDRTAEGDDALVAILRDGDILEALLIEGLADSVRDVRGLGAEVPCMRRRERG
jgi:hypothetical protein